jgi:SAM-dependent methyltransferase
LSSEVPLIADPAVTTDAPVESRPAAAARTRAPAAVLVVFATAVFTSAFLLFLVQPMFGKMVLPLLGGSPAVWNTCMLFFQAALLGGYLYAHLSSERLGVRGQAALHLALLLAAALALPIGVAGAAPEGGRAPIPWLLLLMTTTVGLPFFVLSGTGPMLQRWFAASGHPGAANPYWLYAGSNLGSMLGLLGYPFLLEPRLRLAEQSGVWTLGYALLALLVAGCAAAVWRAQAPPARPAADDPTAADALPHSRTPALAHSAVGGWQRAVWVMLAFVPSSLLLGVTSYISTDLSAMALLWVVPLALYLLSFTLVFAPRQVIPHRWMVAVQPSILTLTAILLLFRYVSEPMLFIPLHLLGLFVTAMVCHGELARRRPAVRHLTEFYLWISVGGVLGGIFNVLVAPVVFPRVWEYPLVLALACLARPWPEEKRPVGWHAGTALAAFVFAGVLIAAVQPDAEQMSVVGIVVIGLVINLVAVVLQRAPLYLALCIGGMLLVRIWTSVQDDGTLLAARSFFGSYRVYEIGVRDRYHVLTHGSTLHGAQSLDPARRRDPITYYLRHGPVGRIFNGTPIVTGTRRIAIVGLGTGTTAAYAAEGEEWTYYEIDPGIEKIARNPAYFTYLADARAPIRVVLGDARLSLARETEPRYHLLWLDAFSSDAIPTHLLTREALDVYLRRLAPGGVIVFHLSNRYYDLEPVVGALVKERGLAARVGSGPDRRSGRYEQYATFLVAARTEADLGVLARDPRWKPPATRADVRPWTDDYSSLLSVFNW